MLTGEDEVVLQPKRKQAEHFTTQQGVATEATTDPLGGARNLSNIDAGDHVSYAPISLSGVPRLRFRVASAGAGGTIEARLDSPTARSPAPSPCPVTGGWQQWQFVDMDIAESAQQGSHELFLVFTNANPVGHRPVQRQLLRRRRQGRLGQLPTAGGAQGTPTQGTAPLTVDFTGSASDYDGDELTYSGTSGCRVTATPPPPSTRSTPTPSRAATRPG